MNKKVVIWVSVLVIVVATSAVFAVLFMKSKWSEFGQSRNLTADNPVDEKLKESTAQLSNQSALNGQTKIAEIYKDKQVRWYNAPKVIANPKFFKGDDVQQFKTWEVGELRGNAEGQKLIIVSLNPDAPSGTDFFYLLFDPNIGTYSYLPKYSSSNFLSAGQINEKLVNSYPVNWLSINSLEYPGVIMTPKGQKLIKEEDFPQAVWMDEKLNFDNIFFSDFNDGQLSKYYSDPVYGDIFYDKENESFYLKVVDGTYKKYVLSMDIVGELNIPEITWNDGTKNNVPFTYKGVNGCGLGLTADVIDTNDPKSEFKELDLTPAGKDMTGNPVYGLKDLNHPYLKKWYKENLDMISGFGDVSDIKFKKNMTYDQFVNQKLIFFWRDSMGQLIRFINTEMVVKGGCGKPVIYLYPEKEEKISVAVRPTGGITYSEPDYGDGWNVIADPKSNILNTDDGKKYPYLYWEGRSNESYRMPEKGFVVSRENLESFLDEKLARLGLIEKEIADFKEFWLPRMLMENKPYLFVTFNSQSLIDKLAPLTINPRPDTTIRVLMDYKGIDEIMNVAEFNIVTPRRKGFTVVEWGGVLK